jgi:hypothetical protein
MADPETSAESPEQQQEQSEYKPEPEEPDCSQFPPPGECDGVDDLTCIAAGDKAKADYNATFAEDLKTAKKDYETTRAAYRTARHDQRLLVEDLRNQLKHLVERIGCQIEQKRVRKCLDDAFRDVLNGLKCCRDKDPCCTEDCEFPLDDIEKLSLEELTALITKYQARIDEAKNCFAELKKEPEELKNRVADVKKAVDDINTELGGDAAKVDLKRAYAEALVAQWKIGKVWGGFEQVQDFVDCLCQALSCWTKGCQAVYTLTGAKAVADCKDTARQEYCEKLRTQTVEQILAGYDKRCAKKDNEECRDDDDNSDDDDDDYDHDHDHDCGCHHHHHHDHESSKGRS